MFEWLTNRRKVQELEDQVYGLEAQVDRLSLFNKNQQKLIEDLTKARDHLVIIAKGRKRELREHNVDVQAVDMESLIRASSFNEEIGDMTYNRLIQSEHPLEMSVFDE